MDLLLDAAIKTIPHSQPPTLGNNSFGNPQWHTFEYEMWRMGEEIRQLLLREKRVVLTEEHIEKIILVINSPFAGHGRQPFIWLLAKRRYACLAPKIIGQIYDDTVSLHIFDTIYKMRAMGYEREILDFEARFKPLTADRKKIARYMTGFC